MEESEATAAAPWDSAEIEEAAIRLSEQLGDNLDRQRDVEEIVNRYLGASAVDTSTASELYQALELYLDEDFAGYLIAYLANADQDPDLLKDFDTALEAETGAFLRKLLALFGSDATEATLIANEEPDGWRTIEREVYFDLLSSSWKVRLDVVTYGGDTTHLEETPNSVLILARGLIDTVVTASTGGGADVLEADQVDMFLEAVKQLETVLHEGTEATAQAP